MKPQTFRPDIEGLRGVAILLVVAYHSRFPLITGGFIGVDVFFVVSGYLITGLLVDEIESTGRIDFAGFYARRARRLLPAAVFVLIVTLFLGCLVLPPVDHRTLASTALVTALYVSNLWFVHNATDYLAVEAETNPLLHTWSLAVEEQFYVIWPALVFLAMLGLRRQPSRRRLVVVLSVVGVVSLAIAIWLTRVAQPWAFFTSPARAWEFVIGAVARLIPNTHLMTRPFLAHGFGWVGALAVVLASLQFDRTTSFPGIAATVPVIGTALLLMVGAAAPHAGPLRVLTTRPMQWIGTMSYSWYLWHWPIPVLVASVVGPLGLGMRVALAALTLGLAALVHVTIENPLRFNRRLRRPAAALAMAAGITVFGAIASWWGVAAAARLVTVPPQHRFEETRKQIPRIYSDGCHLSLFETELRECAYGDRTSPVTVVLFGDSHAAHWFPAIERAGLENHWKVVALTKSACPAADVELFSRQLGRQYIECDRWRAAAMLRIVELAPHAVVVVNYSRYIGPHGESNGLGVTAAQWRAGIEKTARRLSDGGIHVLLLNDTPIPDFDVPSCLSRAAWRPVLQRSPCTFDPSTTMNVVARQINVDTARRGSVWALDVSPMICSAAPCGTQRDGVVMFRDSHHMSVQFSYALGPDLARHVHHFMDVDERDSPVSKDGRARADQGDAGWRGTPGMVRE